MVEISANPLEKLNLNKYYKYLLYLTGIILISSMIVEPKSVDISSIRRFCLNTIILGIILWIFEDIIHFIAFYIQNQYEDRKLSDDEAQSYATGLTIFYYIIMVIGFIIWVSTIPFPIS